MKKVETSAKTVEEAIKLGLNQLNASRDEVEVEVLSEGRHGLLGLRGEDARVCLHLLENEYDDDIAPGNQMDAGDLAQSILETLLDKMDIEAYVDILPEKMVTDEESQPSTVLNIVGEDLGILIGRKGQTLISLQQIIRLMLSHQLGRFEPVVVDVNGYRQRRLSSLQSLAWRTAEQVKLRHMPFSLEPMPAYERRIIHLALAGDDEVTTQSVGFGESRKVVVVLKE
ncbi:MAG: RNA-binding cell elongation regulator Jag/EloR [Dehalococcoides mccartyi]|uniref:RNA-binding protein KhpB n=1 Tax=Dehalococcoides mccartyi TaxID=61435 RepID=A0A0V8M0A1_9CHLR|nr:MULTISPECIES: RNA-binding cell elongation regulator Jag/EloR [Dehalococcoides]AII59661.1 SpoIIIJ-associated protein Jag [Dehalococcoides mccartyi CG4]AQU03318.1 RNA-binding protein [Dehalococcoides mccartyi]AQU04616.1 RNA-binding protein [Dehalococcoides mccartyi]KSV17211.1 RNA-binding protein [Dehalococcoides mccartyi]MBF4482308.1 protein jag [Dehalococcoides mccartyi]